MTEDALARAQARLAEEKRRKSAAFANGREVRNLFEEAVLNQNDRLSRREELTDEELSLLTAEDFR